MECGGFSMRHHPPLSQIASLALSQDLCNHVLIPFQGAARKIAPDAEGSFDGNAGEHDRRTRVCFRDALQFKQRVNKLVPPFLETYAAEDVVFWNRLQDRIDGRQVGRDLVVLQLSDHGDTCWRASRNVVAVASSLGEDKGTCTSPFHSA